MLCICIKEHPEKGGKQAPTNTQEHTNDKGRYKKLNKHENNAFFF